MSVRSRARTLHRRVEAVIAASTAVGRQEASSPAPPDAVVAEVMRRDQSDFQQMRRLLAFTLGADDNCIDVGAHRGAVLAEMVRAAPAGRHLAFEPIPGLCELLMRSFPSVEVRQAALSDHSGVSQFAHVRGSAEGWSGLRYRPLPTGEQADVENIEVELEVLDDVLEPGYRPRLIKVDVEGAEQQVLRGAIVTLRRHRPIVIFEHGSGSAETYDTGPADIYALLCDEVGYRIFDLDGNGPYSLDEFKRTFHSGERVNFVSHA